MANWSNKSKAKQAGSCHSPPIDLQFLFFILIDKKTPKFSDASSSSYNMWSVPKKITYLALHSESLRFLLLHCVLHRWLQFAKPRHITREKSRILPNYDRKGTAATLLLTGQINPSLTLNSLLRNVLSPRKHGYLAHPWSHIAHIDAYVDQDITNLTQFTSLNTI